MSPEAVAAMIDEASDGVAFVEDGRYTYCNRAWGDLLGRPSAAFEGRSVFDDVHPDFRGAWSGGSTSRGAPRWSSASSGPTTPSRSSTCPRSGARAGASSPAT
ncbi:MAG: PAS domain-containing protein [Deltaproteobacteria bacterium]|nr:PAS domain-containing protein [Deltaproteobacteria bacterium]